MVYELFLISAVIGGSYWGVYFLRHQPQDRATFGIMHLAAAALAGLGLIGRQVGAAWLGVAGAIGLGAATCLLLVGPLVRLAAHRLIAAERLGAAMRLLDVAELLVPGSGVTEEKVVLRAMTDNREGRIEQTVDALTAAKERAPADARLAIDERIAILYLAAYRWSEAIAHAEAHLFGAPPPDDSDGSLRRALGFAAPVWVELLGAYGRLGDLEQAARMVARLEDVCSGREDAALWIHRARVMFLAMAGRTEAVRALIAPRQARHMSEAARSYWMAVAHEHHGDRAEAVVAYQRARDRSRGRPRELIEVALAKLAELAEPSRAELAEVASEVVARIEAAPLPPPVRMPRSRTARGTWLVSSLVLGISAATTLALGPTGEISVLVRAGALVHGAVAQGEWWRVVSCLVIHAGIAHVLLNTVALVLLGRLAEDMFGTARMIALLAVSGLAGALASYLAAPAGLTAGASGAVFGVLGALLVELAWHRERYRAAWKRGMWGALAVVAVGEMTYGLFYPMIDQWAHGVGLGAGALLGLALSPWARWARASQQAARAIAVAFGVVLVVAGVLVVRTPLARTITAGERTRFVVERFAITAPASWESSSGQLYQPDGLVVLQLAHKPLDAPVPTLFAAWTDYVKASLKKEVGELATAQEAVVAPPPGWEGTELESYSDDPMGNRQHFRVIVCGRAFGDTMVVTEMVVPDGVASAAPAFLAELIASIAPAS